MADHSRAFGKAYRALHADLRSGRFAPGTRIAASDLGPRLQVSATPIREALSRLAGQSLLIDRPAIGYFVPTVDPIELKDIYAFAATLALGALATLTEGAIAGLVKSHSERSRHRTAGELVRAIGSASPNLVLQKVAVNIDDRLARLSEVETHMLLAADQSEGNLEDWLAWPSRRQTVQGISRFYRRRILAVMEIASTASRTLGNPDNIVT